MALPTTNDVQAVDPVLTNMLIGYQQADSRFVASRVFPGIPVDKDSGTYYAFTKKYWFTNEMASRAPGTAYPRADFGVETSTYATLQFALAKSIADEQRANSQVPMDLETAAIQWLAQKSLIKKEVAFSADFMKTTVWGTDYTGGSSFTKWSDYQNSDPVSDLITGKRTVSNNTGMDPNTAVMGYIVWQRLVNHPDILDRIKYTTAAVMGNAENALAAVFGIQNFLVGKAVYSNTNEASAFSATAIIDDDLLLAYVAPTPGIFVASAGYTFYWAPGGGLGSIMPMVRLDEMDADLIKHKEQWDQAAVATDCGFFYSDCVD